MEIDNVRTFRDLTPQLGKGVYISNTALIIGDVSIGDDSSVWFHSVIRGDINAIRIGRRTNIQDNCVLHVDFEKYAVEIGDEVTIGHNATIHGCTIGSRVLIGMGAIVLSGATIGTGAIVAAGAVVREHQDVPSGTLVAGVPAKPVRKVLQKEQDTIVSSAQHYVDYAAHFKEY